MGLRGRTVRVGLPFLRAGGRGILLEKARPGGGIMKMMGIVLSGMLPLCACVGVSAKGSAPGQGGEAGERVDALWREADGLFRAKEHERAQQRYFEIVELAPEDPSAAEALLFAGASYEWIASNSGDDAVSRELFEKERRTLRRLIDEYPDSARVGEAYLYLGELEGGFTRAAVDPGDCPKAVPLLEKAAEKSPEDWIKAQAAKRIQECAAQNRGG